MKISRAVLYGAVLLVASIAVVYVWNPLGVPSLDPRGRVLGLIPYRLPTISMEPTLARGSYLGVCTAAYRGAQPHSGDVIAFISPLDPPVVYVKRIVAVSGSAIEINNSRIYVDGSPLNEPYLVAGDAMPDFKKTVVPDNHVFVVGDNRAHSQDSRHFGPVSNAVIIGKVCIKL
jgi:signal peptidase I